ncbi:MAG: DoxX family membrane protein [Phycisphaerales bacterium]|nr:DoxX family membrane protein [Phycisphaerales bacterium]
MSAKRWVESLLLQFPLRVGLGGVFCLAAWTKMGDIQSFAEAIKGFKVLDAKTHEHLIINAAFTMPWVEMIAGVLLVLGMWTRASAAVVALMLVVFMAALLHVIFNDVPADCSCFGDLSVVCPSTVGWCQVIRDVVLLAPAVYLIWRGGGKLGLDALCGQKSAQKPADEGFGGVDGEGLRG